MYKPLSIIIFLMGIMLTLSAQKSIFLRVYTTTGDRITKGRFVAVTDSSLKIFDGNANAEKEISYHQIGLIKTLHSKGHNMAMAGIVGAVAGGVVGALSGEPRKDDGTLGGAIIDIFTITPAEGFVLGFFTGAVVGAPVGLLFNNPKKRKVYTVNGNLQSWLQVSQELKTSIMTAQP